MSDLPPYLTNNNNRREPWKGHATFPRNVVRIHSNGESWGSYGLLKAEDLRVFKLHWDELRDPTYIQMTKEQIQRYVEDPTRV